MGTPSEHSTRGPSSWSRWLRCVGAPQAEAPFPNVAGVEAAQGTVFHEMVSDCLELGLWPEHWVGSRLTVDGHDIEVDWEMVESCQEGMNYIYTLAASPDVEVYVEQRFSIAPWAGEGEFGTCDVAIANRKERWVIIFDWKYGMEPVWPQENEQCMGYCLGFWEDIGWKIFGDPDDVKVTFVIEQPRVPGAGGAWDSTMQRVLEFGEYVKGRALRSREPNAPRTAGEKQCRWCRARNSCGEHAAYMLDVMGAKFADLDDGVDSGEELPLPVEVTPERRSYILKHRPMINRWLEGMHASAYSDALAGHPVPSFILVPGRHPRRVWRADATHKAEVALRAAVGDQTFKTQMVSPAEAEKLVGKKSYAKDLARFVDKGDPKPILADEKDTRDPIESALEALARYTEEE